MVGVWHPLVKIIENEPGGLLKPAVSFIPRRDRLFWDGRIPVRVQPF